MSTISNVEVVAASLAPAAPSVLPVRKRLFRATVWTLLGTHSGQLIRLASNLILTRLLFPEAFGLMAIVQLLIQSLYMFSDLGIQVSLVQDARGENEAFVNTAWTLQVLRGVMLWVGTCIGAAGLHILGQLGWLPEGSVLADPALVWLLPVAGLNCIAVGFNSTKLVTLRRRLTVGYEVIHSVCLHAVQAAIMIAWAWIYPSVWALVGGGILAMALGAIASQRFLPGPANRFAWDPLFSRDLIRFGRFIFVSTIFTFIGVSAQRAILGGIMTAELFGIFSIALALSMVIVRLMDRICQNVLFPLYSELVRQQNPDALAAKVHRVRRLLLALAVPPMWVLVLAGPWLIRLLYDTRYEAAGWMLQILAVTAIVRLLSATVDSVMLAHGDAKLHLHYSATTSILTVAAMVAGAWLGGATGVLVGSVAGGLLSHIVLCAFIRRYRAGSPQLDVMVVVLTALVIVAGWSAS